MSGKLFGFGLRLVLAVLAIPLLAVALLALPWIVSGIAASLKEGAFNGIPENATRSSVVAVMGKPDAVRVCGENLWWGGDSQSRGRNDGRCLTEERYEYFLTAYGIGYSADGHVVSKYRYVSE